MTSPYDTKDHTPRQIEEGTEYPSGTSIPDFPRRPPGSSGKQCKVCPVQGGVFGPRGSSKGCSAYCKRLFRENNARTAAVEPPKQPATYHSSAKPKQVSAALYWPTKHCRRKHTVERNGVIVPAPRYQSTRTCIECAKGGIARRRRRLNK